MRNRTSEAVHVPKSHNHNQNNDVRDQDGGSKGRRHECFPRRFWKRTRGDCFIDFGDNESRKKESAHHQQLDSSLEDRARWTERWELSYLNPLLSKGARSTLKPDDLGAPSQQDRAERVHRRIMRAWRRQKLLQKTGNSRPSFALALLEGFGYGRVASALVCYFVSALMGFVPILVLHDLVLFFDSEQSIQDFYYSDSSSTHSTFSSRLVLLLHDPRVQVAALAVVPILSSLLLVRYQSIMAHFSAFARTAVSTMLYDKSLKVSAQVISTGQVLNFMSNDASQLQRMIQFAGNAFVAPLQIVLSLILIYQQVGHATWTGAGFMVALAPVNVFVFAIITRHRRLVLRHSDRRVTWMNEILTGIRTIKYNAWEEAFRSRVDTIRRQEMQALTRLAYTSAVAFSLLLMSVPLVQPILVFWAYGKPLDAAKAFTTVALFNFMRFPIAFFPMGMMKYSQSRIALRRLEEFLNLPELSNYVESPPLDNHANCGTVQTLSRHDRSPLAEYGSISIRSGSFGWAKARGKEDTGADGKKKRRWFCLFASRHRRQKEKSDQAPLMSELEEGGRGSASHSHPTITLSDVTLSVWPGSLVAIVGRVGSGKSSLLSAILGEMEPIGTSTVSIPRPNNAPSNFLSHCGQSPWIVNDTLRGNILFGREFDKERYDKVIEACALLPDLAALPASDLTELGERGVNLSGGQNARIALARALYSTQTAIALLDDPLSAVDVHVADHIFSQAIAGNLSVGMTRVLVTHQTRILSQCDWIVVLEQGHIKYQGSYKDLIALGVDFSRAVEATRATIASLEQDGVSKVDHATKETERERSATGTSAGAMLISEEERNVGSVDSAVYFDYVRLGGYCTAVMAIIIQVLSRGCEVLSCFWLAQWAKYNSSLTSKANYDLKVYAFLCLTAISGFVARSLLLARHRLCASTRLHDRLTGAILRAPVGFFDLNPVGRILNCFAADMDKVDVELTQSLSNGLSTLFSILGSVAAMVAATKGTFLAPLGPMTYAYFRIQNWFRKTSTELQRINSTACSPIFSNFSQTLSGTSTIRAFGAENHFFQQFQALLNQMNTSYTLLQHCNFWLAIRLDILGALVSAFAAGVALATSSSGFIPAAWLGLALSYSIEMSSFLKYGVKLMASTEAQMNSVERILHYTDHIDQESPILSPPLTMNNWPTKGEIEFQNVSLRYRDGPSILKNISFSIRAGEKVGVCGRTGSGKSSVVAALVRIFPIDRDGGGKILIDGVDTAEIGTDTLRRVVTVLSQVPVLFSSTVRFNLDPFGNATDEELWEALAKVQLDQVVAQLPQALEEPITEGGTTFSHGQRQLLRISCVLLRRPRVLIMDESTASIDNRTDAAIQQVIRENFCDATVFTIAHRLNTILDSDRVLVMDEGEVAEFDEPRILLEREDGLFRSMLEQSRASALEEEE